ncbi:MAG: hypothetical protein M3Z40_07075 [Bifidobacterium sp.]|nr:hypothetical protein [Bifidobacterium sp.]
MEQPTHTDVSAERDYAIHLATEALAELGQALIEGRRAHVHHPMLDPMFAAVSGRSLQLLSERLGQLQVSAPSRSEGKIKGPDLEHPGPAISKEK